jgi:hypothetical protein
MLVSALAAVVVITAGSAATTTKPYTASFDPGPIAGGGTVHVNLAIKKNGNANPQRSARPTFRARAPGALRSRSSVRPRHRATRPSSRAFSS